MKGDFSRWSFDPKKQFSRVLMQQGRVQLDADWNEQGSIFLHHLRALAADLIGPHGGPDGGGFEITPARSEGSTFDDTFAIGNGHYYVAGILATNDDDEIYDYKTQPYCTPKALANGRRLAYLDVWERHVTYLEDEGRPDDPSIREVALGGADTTTRVQVVWQVGLTTSTLEDETIGLTKYSNILEGIKSILSKVTINITELGWLVDEATLLLSDRAAGDRTIEEVLTAINGLLNELYIDVAGTSQKSYVIQLNDLISQLPANNQLPAQILSFKKHLQVVVGFINATNFPLFDPADPPTAPTDLDPLPNNLNKLITMTQALGVEIDNLNKEIETDKQAIEDWLQAQLNRQVPQLKAWAGSNGNGSSNAVCTIPPDAQYRGLENRLYRVEIHQGNIGATSPATFKWSRENGSIAFRIERAVGELLTLKDWWPDSYRGLKKGDWVEIIDDEKVLDQKPGLLAQVVEMDDIVKTVRVTTAADIPDYDETSSSKHPLLRRWESGATKIEGSNFELEDEIKIEFDGYENKEFRTGDYWLIPARTEIGNVIWPGSLTEPEAQPPVGIDHHYAPLAIIEVNGDVEVIADCRRLFPPLGAFSGA
jgi:hypothetical protein